jgi:hypothetical protein
MASTIVDAEADNMLRRLALREEVLEICYWFQGEGFGDRFTATSLETFLSSPRADIVTALEWLASEGALVQDGATYRFSADGKKRAGHLFHETFADFQVGTHGECSAGCCDSEDKDDEKPSSSPAQVRAKASG